MNIRLAEEKDISQLIKMRWDFTLEDDETGQIKETSFVEFEKECRDFLENALKNDQWFIWVAEEHGKIVSHIYIELIQKVPRPGRITYPFAYMTNVFTVKEYRNKGVGSRLLAEINQWAEEQKYEFIIVWPSEDSVSYYKKNGYVHGSEAMEFISS
ncbi:GNAT family N-acetyltransferase [Salipaludibacillus keqinensis]|uniref:GNAT family N-acetyltransferase n=1 Tax=Salipaludibacillus keqinensis TaxID=2045207 RepID=A0A323TEI9_9BACI|nr:GNAT family N-acetyltransferase [Salipaludibacillus keqinensis]PYZ93389.1 GNAT family N-acetyltransferase [Salipaludibacillus keqinensis]